MTSTLNVSELAVAMANVKVAEQPDKMKRF